MDSINPGRPPAKGSHKASSLAKSRDEVEDQFRTCGMESAASIEDSSSICDSIRDLFASQMTIGTRADGSVPDHNSTSSEPKSLPSELWTKVFDSADFSLEDYRSFSLIEQSALGPASERLFAETDLRSKFTGRLSHSKRFKDLIKVGHANVYNDQYRAEWLPDENPHRGPGPEPLSEGWTPGSKQIAAALSNFSKMECVILRHFPFQGTISPTSPSSAYTAPKWWFNVLSRLPQIKTLRLYGPVTGISIPGEFFELAKLSEDFLKQLSTLELGVIWRGRHTPFIDDVEWRITQILDEMPSLRVLKLHNHLELPPGVARHMRETVLPLVKFQLKDFTAFANQIGRAHV